MVRSYNPLDIVKLPTPKDLYTTIIHPHIEVQTKDAREILKKELLLRDAVIQWGNVAGLVTGLFTSDYNLIGRSLQDVIIEPVRSILIPGYQRVKDAALEAGALGCSISGSGPSIFALCKGKPTAEKVAYSMQEAFDKIEIESDVYISEINQVGPLILN